MDEQRNLFTEPSAVFSVGEFLDYVNVLVSARSASVRGEVTGAKPHSTGFYFSLKEATPGGSVSLMDCYMSPYAYRGLGFAVEDGTEVKVTGTASMYKPRGRFTFRADSIELAGEGSLKKAYDLLKKKLEAEGLFTRKREIPMLVRSVGVITSRTGAVIDDFRKNLLPVGLKIYLYDSRVEGAQAVPSIIRGINHFNEHHPDLDLLVIIRGGGSLEDLQAFNNEDVVRAVFGSKIPTACGIGHDRDVPLVSLVADTMTSTPTAVATVVINATWAKLRERIPFLARTISSLFSQTLDGFSFRVSQAALRSFAGVEKIFTLFKVVQAKFENRVEGLGHAIRERINLLDRFSALLEARDPERNLKLGYSIIRGTNGSILRSAHDVKRGDSVTARLGDGEFTANVLDATLTP